VARPQGRRLRGLDLDKLRKRAEEIGIEGRSSMKKSQLTKALRDH